MHPKQTLTFYCLAKMTTQTNKLTSFQLTIVFAYQPCQYHGRQSSSTSTELSQYLPHQTYGMGLRTSPYHSRQDSSNNNKTPPMILSRRPYVIKSSSGSSSAGATGNNNALLVVPPTLLKLSPNSIDLGYHTMVSISKLSLPHGYLCSLINKGKCKVLSNMSNFPL